MTSVNFNVVRSSDRELVDAVNAMVANGHGDVASQRIHFSFLSGGDIQIPAADLGTNEVLKSVVSDDVRLFSAVRIETALGQVSIQRHDPKGANFDNTQPFDTVSVSPRSEPRPQPHEFSRLVGFAQKHLGRFSVNALSSYLGEDAKRHFEARDVALARLEQLVAKLTFDLEEARKAKDAEVAAKEKRLEDKYQAKDAELDATAKQRESEVDQRKRELDDREASLNLQAAKAERRQVRQELKKMFKEWSQKFEITENTKRLRWIIHAFSVGTLILFATFAAIYLNQSLDVQDATRLISLHIKRAVSTALFVAMGIFYAKWNAQWFQKRANEEFRLKRMELDFDRASWLVELMFQWKDEHKDEPLPFELIERLTGHLFVPESPEQPPQHPYETIGSALVGAGAKLKLGPTGVEVELDRKGIQQLSPQVPYCIPNELICAEIGRFLYLPAPPAGTIHAPGANPPDWFASLDFNLTGNALPPVDPARSWAELPDLSTGLLLFDILVANCDRHRQNFSVDFLATPPVMSVFDHSHALFGFQTGQGVQRFAELRDRLGVSGASRTHGNRHCLLDALTTDAHFGKWIERISALPNFLIEELCRDAVGLGITATEAVAAVDFLKYRRDNFRRIIDSSRTQFGGIQQWSLLP